MNALTPRRFNFEFLPPHYFNLTIEHHSPFTRSNKSDGCRSDSILLRHKPKTTKQQTIAYNRKGTCSFLPVLSLRLRDSHCLAFYRFSGTNLLCECEFPLENVRFNPVSVASSQMFIFHNFLVRDEQTLWRCWIIAATTKTVLTKTIEPSGHSSDKSAREREPFQSNASPSTHLPSVNLLQFVDYSDDVNE